jgi:predicted AlkP superfamily phosphohydrolase/phosphomutase
LALKRFPSLLKFAGQQVRRGALVSRGDPGSGPNTSELGSKVLAFNINDQVAWVRIIAETDNERASIMANLLKDLQELRDSGLIKRVYKPDELYSGGAMHKALGDLLVEGNDGWLVDTVRLSRRGLVGQPIFTNKGGHVRIGLLAIEPKMDSLPSSASIYDVMPTILEILGLNVVGGLDGKALLKRTYGFTPAYP